MKPKPIPYWPTSLDGRPKIIPANVEALRVLCTEADRAIVAECAPTFGAGKPETTMLDDDKVVK
jgi:hypothetical protein